MTEFHLREHVRHILATTPGENVDELVAAVFVATSAADYAEAYRQALAPIVRVALATAERPDPQTAQLGHGRNDAQDRNAGLGASTDGEEAIPKPEPAQCPNCGPTQACTHFRREVLRIKASPIPRASSSEAPPAGLKVSAPTGRPTPRPGLT